jgi:hypothetical protein
VPEAKPPNISERCEMDLSPGTRARPLSGGALPEVAGRGRPAWDEPAWEEPEWDEAEEDMTGQALRAAERGKRGAPSILLPARHACQSSRPNRRTDHARPWRRLRHPAIEAAAGLR